MTKYAKTRDQAREVLDGLLLAVRTDEVEDLKPRPRETLSDFLIHWRQTRLQLEIIKDELRQQPQTTTCG